MINQVALEKLVVSAFLFDMDGTLVDSGASVERAWAYWARRHNLDLTELLEYSHGRPTLATMEYFGERFAPGTDWNAEADEMQAFEAAETTDTLAILGSKELLAQLSNAPWAVVTSAPRALAESRIVAAGLPLPQVLVPADEITQGKPHPEGFLKAVHALGMTPQDCVVFEDTPPGVEAGLNAGIPVIGLLTTVPAARLKTDRVIRNYHDLRVTPTGSRFTIEFVA